VFDELSTETLHLPSFIPLDLPFSAMLELKDEDMIDAKMIEDAHEDAVHTGHSLFDAPEPYCAPGFEGIFASYYVALCALFSALGKSIDIPLTQKCLLTNRGLTFRLRPRCRKCHPGYATVSRAIP
jgi:hypothetical protein